MCRRKLGKIEIKKRHYAVFLTSVHSILKYTEVVRSRGNRSPLFFTQRDAMRRVRLGRDPEALEAQNHDRLSG